MTTRSASSIGPNGAGKTTVLDLSAANEATSGSIHFRDKDLTKMKENQMCSGRWSKFQTPSIYDDLTVFENLEISFPRAARCSAR